MWFYIILVHTYMYNNFCIVQVKKRPEIPEQNNDKMDDGQAAELAWKHHQLCNESIIVELFQVWLTTQNINIFTCLISIAE